MIHSGTTLLVTPPVDFLAAARRYIKARTKQYTPAEVDYIISLYTDVCRAGEVDVELLITQMIHETAGLTSAWSSPTKRNPAGIGVTGATDPVTGEALGFVFDTWADAVEAHVGLILCYRFATGQGSPSQQKIINDYLLLRPSAPRNVATTLAQMAVKWAADPAYVTTMVRVNEVVSAA